MVLYIPANRTFIEGTRVKYPVFYWCIFNNTCVFDYSLSQQLKLLLQYNYLQTLYIKTLIWEHGLIHFLGKGKKYIFKFYLMENLHCNYLFHVAHQNFINEEKVIPETFFKNT